MTRRGSKPQGLYPHYAGGDMHCRLSWWKHCADYFPTQLIKTADLDPEGRYIFVVAPHGELPPPPAQGSASSGTGVVVYSRGGGGVQQRCRAWAGQHGPTWAYGCASATALGTSCGSSSCATARSALMQLANMRVCWCAVPTRRGGHHVLLALLRHRPHGLLKEVPRWVGGLVSVGMKVRSASTCAAVTPSC
jgi:hypothetical protein